MTKDRTEEFRRAECYISSNRKITRKWSRENSEETVSLNPSYKLPTIAKGQKKEQESLKAIFKEVNLIQSWIKSIEDDTAMLKQCHRIAQQSTRTDESTKDKIQDLMANVRSYSSRTRGGLAGLNRHGEGRKDDGVLRVIQTQHTILNKEFIKAMEEYNQTLTSYKKKNEDIIKKHLYIVLEVVMKRLPIVPADKEVTNEQLSSMLDSEETAIFADNYLKDKAVSMLHLKEAQIRHMEILAIEKEITEIRDLYLDIAEHIHDQGQTIDKIENYIIKGANRAHGANKELDTAVRKKARARRKKIILIAILLLILGILIVYLLVHFSSPSS